MSTLEWVFDGEPISTGTDFSVTTFASLGSHLMEVTATLVTGHTDSDSQAVAIQDTLAPDLAVGFIDMRSHEPIVEIADNQTHFVEIQMLAEDVCDPAPVVNGNVVPVFPVNNADVIKVQGSKGQIDMPATALNLSGAAIDASGNTKNETATLHIITGH